jgi:hypothetical protein
MNLTWSSTLDGWQALKLDLQLEAESVFASSGEVVLVVPNNDSGSVITLESRTGSLKLTYLPDKSVVRWDLPREYGFERVSGQTTSLARILIRLLRR